jgi:O-succinylbenzoate synthase
MQALHYHPYTLYSRGALNAVSVRSEFHGALIRVDEGVGCLHPWPEFGDAPIEGQLQLLRDGGTSRVIECALRMAAVDGAARRMGMSLFNMVPSDHESPAFGAALQPASEDAGDRWSAGFSLSENLSGPLPIPPCHWSWDQNQPSPPQMNRVIEEGWQAIKTKGWGNVGEVLRWLDSFAGKSRDSDVRLRVDFNSCLQPYQFRNFMEWMTPRVRQRLDFVEDPFPYDPALWAKMQADYGVRLALDKQLRGANEGFDVAVLKPGRRDWREFTTDIPAQTKVVMTSAMDHAIGQSFAAWEAAVAWQELGDRMDLCGLCTEHLFAEDDFFARLKSHGGQLTVDRAGTGLGFDDVIRKIPWQGL